jgi:hypothetical protein
MIKKIFTILSLLSLGFQAESQNYLVNCPGAPIGGACGSGFNPAPWKINTLQIGTSGSVINNVQSPSVCGTDGYTNYTGITGTMMAGQTYPLTAILDKNNWFFGYIPQLHAWADWNNDGDFNDANEQMLIPTPPSVGPPGDNTWQGSITVPANTAPNAVRLRLMLLSNDAGAPPFPDPCSINGVGGEIEDYTLSIIAPPPTNGLTCNGNVNLSLDDDCQVPLTRQITLVNGGSAASVYTFNIKNGTTSLGDIANASMVGKYLQFTVKDASGNTCWGNLLVEDKTPPKMICPSPIIKKCEDFDVLDISLSEKEWKTALPAGVLITDNCVTPKIFYSDDVQNLPCSNPLSAIVKRTFRAIDAQGLTATCTVDYNLERRTLAEVIMPGDFTIECDKVTVKNVAPSVSGAPSLAGKSAYPSSNLLCGIATTYTDAYTGGCGNSFKIIRTWIVTDCAAGVKTSQQVINVKDTQAPVFEACSAALLTIGATGNNCDLDNLNLPIPKAKDNCDPNPTYSVVLKKGADIIAAGFPIHDLQLGNYTIEYRATDVCNNVGICTQMLKVLDNVAPIAVCDQNTKVSLTIDGNATVAAETFNDGSRDNCCLDPNSFVIKRMSDNDAAFAKNITFTCKDTLVQVVMRVSDCHANTNICMVNVRVEDKIAPVIVTQDTAVLCSTDAFAKIWLDKHRPARGSLLRYPSAAFPGWFENAADCGYKIDSVDIAGIDNCGKGTYSRTWTIKDKRGLSATTTQKYVSTAFYDYSVKFPADVQLNTDQNCSAQTSLPDNTGKPVITSSSSSCANVAFRYSDEVTDASGNNVCYVIKRKWQVQNLCEPMTAAEIVARTGGSSVTAMYNSINKGAFEYIQIIKVQDQNPPQFTKVPDVKVEPIGKECKTKIKVERPDANDCTTNIIYTYEIYKPNGILYQLGASFPAEYNFATTEYGTYSIVYRVSDRCGNTTSTKKFFTIKDVLKPTPICHQQVAASLGTAGVVMVPASAFDAGSNDNCTAKKDLKIRIRVLTDSVYNPNVNPDTLLSMYTFKCLKSYIPVGGFLGYTFTVQLWVGDEAGNWDYCETKIEIQDNNQVCVYKANEMRAISGDIATEKGKQVESVKVKMEGLYHKDMTTSNAGKFAFADLPVGGYYTMIPEKNVQPLNGVSTYDLVLLTKHILGTETLQTPYQMIAADVNKSGTITTSDVVELRKMILGLQTGFTKNESWRFVDKHFIFTNPLKPFAEVFPEKVALKGLDLTKENNLSFVAVKIGDVNSSASTLGARAAHTTYFNVRDKAFAKNEQFTVSFAPSEIIEGYQFTLNFDKNKLELIDIQGDKSLFAVLENGILTTSQTSNEGFALTFKAKNEGVLSEAIRMSSEVTSAEAYSKNGETQQADLKFSTATPSFELYQNQPNPFQQTTTISFRLPETSNVTFSISDVNGKIIKTITSEFIAGMNQISLDKSILPSAGIFYYQLETPTRKAVKKMIIVE